MNRFAELLKSAAARPAVIVHLGAGACSEYNLYKAFNPEQVIYVEPDQYLAEAATDRFNSTSHVKVIPCAIASKNRRHTLNITNNRRFSSLLLPGDLLDFYPNISVVDREEIEAITLSRLCQNQEVSKGSDNLLVAELQGMEKEVFPHADIETLQKFKWIIIRSSELSLYAPVSDQAQKSLSAVMQAAGFTVLLFAEESPPFINILCIRNDEAIANDQLKAREADLVGTIRVLEHNLSKHIADLNALRTNHAAEVAELKLSLQASSAELGRVQSMMQSVTAKKENQRREINDLASAARAKSAELDKAQTFIQALTNDKETQQQQIEALSSTADTRTAELDKAKTLIQSITDEKENLQKQIDELSSAADTRTAELGKAEALIQSITDEKENLQRQIDELSSTVNDKSAELDKAQTMLKSLSTEKESQQQQLATLTDALEEKKKEISGMQQTLRINNKLILKSDADLRDLQLQYRAALQRQEQQHNLLSELKEKLRQASVFYQKLNLQNLVIDSDLLEGDKPDSNNSASDDEDKF